MGFDKSIHIYIYPDVTPLERSSFERITSRLMERMNVTVEEVKETHFRILGRLKDDCAWVIARNWRAALSFLGGRENRRRRVYVSVLDLSSPKENVYQVIVKKIFGSIPKNCTLFVHSPINYRFFTEMEGVSQNRLRYLPLPVPNLNTPRPTRDGSTPFTIGTFTSFSSDGQLNYLASVAHYVLSQNPNVRFLLLGSGSLLGHAIQLGYDLELGARFMVRESFSSETISDLDAFIYCPLRNDHFIPLYVSARMGIPIVATEMAGIERYIEDGRSGFIVRVNDVKSMSELLLRLAGGSLEPKSIILRSQEILEREISIDSVFNSYFEALIDQATLITPFGRAA